MDLSFGGSGSGGEEASNSQEGKKQFHRHSKQQIQQLEAFYKESPHLDKNRRQQLSRELGLDQRQIKIWFQYKRTQKKAQHERANYDALRSENERIRSENLAMQEALKNTFCPSCKGSGLGEEERRCSLARLRMENARLKEEHQRTINSITNHAGTSSMPLLGTEPYTDMPGKHFAGQGMGNTTLDIEHTPQNNLISPNWSSGIKHMDKSTVIETAIGAMGELMELLRLKEPVWFKVHANGSYALRRDQYDMLFPKEDYLKTASARFESSKDSGEVAMAAVPLVEMLLDSNKWKDMFPNVVTRARTIEVVDTGSLGGSLHLMYERMHILSPFVAPREFYFIRYCQQLNPSTWVMVDVSYEFIKEFQDIAPTNSWKLPSGCIIEDISNGKSTVTWIEHVQVDEKQRTHSLYRDFVSSCQAYGAKRWITTLQRMCERFAFSIGPTTTKEHELEKVINSPESRRNLSKLSHRMVKNFCEALSMSDERSFGHLSESVNSGIRVSLRRSNEQGQPDGFIVSAATSLWLPLSTENLFNFFKDDTKRAKWDVLYGGKPANAIAQISTGTLPGNCISIIQPFVPSEANMVILQESSIDPLGATLIYAPIDFPGVYSVVDGKDTTRIQILPSGYVISSDGRADKRSGASSSSSSSNPNGSLLTIAFQILVCRSTLTKEQHMESVANVHTLISSTVQKIKATLRCAD